MTPCVERPDRLMSSTDILMTVPPSEMSMTWYPSRTTREPLVPFNGSGDAAAPVARLATAALERGLYLLTPWNVILICPHLPDKREEPDRGITLLQNGPSIAEQA